MALCPFANHRLIPPGANDPRITPRVAVLHVDATNAASLFDYFATRSGGIESHFHIRRDGVIEQYRDTDWQADANHLANPFAVSIETQGYGEGEWTPEQLASIKRLLLWLNATHGIPLAKVDRWDGSGVGYHTQFGAPGKWTPVAKSCPGPDRIRQYHNDIVPWLESGAQEDDMALTADDKAWIKATIEDGPKVDLGDGRTWTNDQVARTILRKLDNNRIDVDTIAKAVASNLAGLVGNGVSIEALEAAAAEGVRSVFREGVGD